MPMLTAKLQNETSDNGINMNDNSILLKDHWGLIGTGDFFYCQ
jgi:hypothetical protein